MDIGSAVTQGLRPSLVCACTAYNLEYRSLINNSKIVILIIKALTLNLQRVGFWVQLSTLSRRRSGRWSNSPRSFAGQCFGPLGFTVYRVKVEGSKAKGGFWRGFLHPGVSQSGRGTA